MSEQEIMIKIPFTPELQEWMEAYRVALMTGLESPFVIIEQLQKENTELKAQIQELEGKA